MFFFVAQLPTDVPHSKYCEQMCVTIPELRIAARKGWQPMVAPIFSGGFIFGPFWLTITEPQSDSTMTFKV